MIEKSERLLEEINNKTYELNKLKEKYNQEINAEKYKVLKSKSTGMAKTLYLLSFNFTSSSERTPQYLEFHNVFRRELKALLKPYTKEIQISKPNHFDVTGFFKMSDDNIYYFSIGDLRWDKEHMLIRTAETFKDYTGGSNGYVNLDKDFANNLLRYIGVKE